MCSLIVRAANTGERMVAFRASAFGSGFCLPGKVKSAYDSSAWDFPGVVTEDCYANAFAAICV